MDKEENRAMPCGPAKELQDRPLKTPEPHMGELGPLVEAKVKIAL